MLQFLFNLKKTQEIGIYFSTAELCFKVTDNTESVLFVWMVIFAYCDLFLFVLFAIVSHLEFPLIRKSSAELEKHNTFSLLILLILMIA